MPTHDDDHRPCTPGDIRGAQEQRQSRDEEEARRAESTPGRPEPGEPMVPINRAEELHGERFTGGPGPANAPTATSPERR